MPDGQLGILLSAAIDSVNAKAKLNAQIKQLQVVALKVGVQLDTASAKQAIKEVEAQMQQAIKKEQVQTQQLQAQKDSFYKKNLNGIDAEIRKRAEASRAFSNQIKSQMHQAVQAERVIASAQKQAIVDDTLATNIKKAQQELLNMKSTMGAITQNSDFSTKWQQLFDTSKIVKSKAELTNLTSKMGLFKKEVNGAGGAMSTSFGGGIKKMLAMYAVTKTIQLAISGIKRMVSEVTALDKSLTELNKVAEFSGEQLDKFTDKAYSAAEQIGRTGREVIDATTEFKRAGYALNESLDMAQSALIMTNVGDGITNVKDAASTLISVLRGFNINESDILLIVDKMNQVSNTSPVGFDNIADGLERVSGTLSQTGTSIDQTIGLLTGGFAQLRNMEKVSTGLIQISQRLRGVDEDGEAIEGLAPKLQEAFSSIANIDIQDSNGELRSTYSILQDLAGAWDTLDSKQKQYIGTLSAGNRQVTVLNAIMQQWEDVDGAVQQSQNSVGSATKENEVYRDSIQGIKNELDSAIQNLSQTVVDADWIKAPLKALTEFVKVLTTLASNDTLMTTLGIFLGYKAFKGVSTVKSGLKSFMGDYKAVVQAIVTGGTQMDNSIGQVGKTAKKSVGKIVPTYAKAA